MMDRDCKSKENYRLFIKLYLANERRIYGYVRALIVNWSDVDDVIQEIASVMWSKFDEFDKSGNFTAWALKIAHYQVLKYCQNHRKDKARFSFRTMECLSEKIASRENHIDERLTILRNCLQKLQADERDLVQMRYEPGATARDISRLTGKEPHLIYRLLDKIHVKLLYCIRRTLAQEAVS